jgi:hypothetical protein
MSVGARFCFGAFSVSGSTEPGRRSGAKPPPPIWKPESGCGLYGGFAFGRAGLFVSFVVWIGDDRPVRMRSGFSSMDIVGFLRKSASISWDRRGSPEPSLAAEFQTGIIPKKFSHTVVPYSNPPSESRKHFSRVSPSGIRSDDPQRTGCPTRLQMRSSAIKSSITR